MNLTALESISTNVSVGLNEVVSVFVSRFEDKLYAKKKQLSDRIRGVKVELEGMEGIVTASVDKTAFQGTVEALGVTFKVIDVTVHWAEAWNKDMRNTVQVHIGLFSGKEKRGHDPEMSCYRTLPIDKKIVAQRKSLQDELETLEQDLLGVVIEIRLISRKERQVRARISEMKLEQAGMADLINHPKLLELIDL